MFSWLKKLLPVRTVTKTVIRSKYDAAQNNDDMRRYWANADALGARTANALAVRWILRNRSRYEFANNGYCQGAILTIANDIIGRGPLLQVYTEDSKFNRAVERLYREWAEEVDYAAKLRECVIAKKINGEAFGLEVSDDDLECPVKFSMQTVEADQVTTPDGNATNPVDGVELNRLGKPTLYHVLREHPGESVPAFGGTGLSDYERIPAKQVRHWFRRDRASQARGIPETTPSLPLFGQLRRFGAATLTAAETAAMFAAMLENDDAKGDGSDDPTPFESLEIERGMMTVTPGGWKMKQLAAQHPNSTYEGFEGVTLRQAGRPLGTPKNVITGDSSGYNFSSARLDSIIYRGGIRVERAHCSTQIMNVNFRRWFREALLIPGYLPRVPSGVTAANIVFEFIFPGFEYIDPAKESKSDTERLKNGTATFAEICAEGGRDWESVMRQRARERRMEIDLAKEFGLDETWNRDQPAAAPVQQPEDPALLDDEEIDPEEEAANARHAA